MQLLHTQLSHTVNTADIIGHVLTDISYQVILLKDEFVQIILYKTWLVTLKGKTHHLYTHNLNTEVAVLWL
jgi:hypothetical protein